MRKTMLPIFLLWALCVVSVVSAPLFGVENATIAGDGVRIREAPKATATILDQINKGTRLEVSARTNVSETINGQFDVWYAVVFKGKKGYIFGRFITLDAGVIVPDEGTPAPQKPSITKTSIRPEQILGDWALYSSSPAIIYTFEPEGLAQYIALSWNVDFSGEKISRKYLTMDLVRGRYTIDGQTIRAEWFWGPRSGDVFEAETGAGGITLTVGGQSIDPRFHTPMPGRTSIEDIVINTEPDL